MFFNMKILPAFLSTK